MLFPFAGQAGPSGQTALLPGSEGSYVVEHALSPYALNQSLQLLGELSAFFTTNSAPAGPPSPPQPVRAIEWAPILSSAISFLGILFVAWICKRLLSDPSARDRSEWYFRGMRIFAQRDSEKGDGDVEQNENEAPTPLWYSILHILWCTGGFLSCYILYGIIQVRTSHACSGCLSVPPPLLQQHSVYCSSTVCNVAARPSTYSGTNYDGALRRPTV